MNNDDPFSDFRDVIDAYDAEHPAEDGYDRRLREKAEAREAEKRKQEREARRHAELIPTIAAKQAANTTAWCQWVDQRMVNYVARWWQDGPPLYDNQFADSLCREIGQALAEERRETTAAIEDVKRDFAAKLEAAEQRVMVHVDRRINEHITQTIERTNALGDTLARERRDRQTEIKSVVDTAQNSFTAELNANFAALGQHVVEHTDRRINEHIAQTTERSSTLWNMIITERSDRRSEIKDTVEEAQRAAETQQATKLEVLEHRIVQHITQHIEQCTERTHALSDAIATGRWDRQKEIKASVEEVQRAIETQQTTKLEALELRVVQHTDQRMFQHIEQCTERTHVLSDIIATERADRQKETNAAVEEAQSAAETRQAAKLEALEQRLTQWTDQRITGREGKGADPETVARFVGERIEEPLHEFIRAQVDTKLASLEQRLKAVPQAEQQANNQRWATIDQRIKHLEREMDGRLGPSALHETQCTVESKLESKLTALEQRLKAVPGKLPVAKTWHPETVAYQAEFVSHEGALWQARKDTAQRPGGDDWVCVARCGRDAITPEVRGTYTVNETYKVLNIVAMDGASFIATCDSPGICPGEGWQLLCMQGKRGRPGIPGERGPRGDKGEKGEPGVMPQLVSSEIDEDYNLIITRSDGAREIIPLRSAFEQYHWTTN